MVFVLILVLFYGLCIIVYNLTERKRDKEERQKDLEEVLAEQRRFQRESLYRIRRGSDIIENNYRGIPLSDDELPE